MADDIYLSAVGYLLWSDKGEKNLVLEKRSKI